MPGRTCVPRGTRPAPRARLTRRLLLPLPRHEVEEISLQYHVALEALRMKRGSAHGLRILLQMVILTGFIDEARRHELRVEVLVAAEREINVGFERGQRESEWRLDASGVEVVASLLAWHDGQIRTTPLAVLVEAMERVERLRDGKSSSRPPVRVARRSAQITDDGFSQY